MRITKSMLLVKSAAIALALSVGGASAETNLEFIQWWEPELPAGALRGISALPQDMFQTFKSANAHEFDVEKLAQGLTEIAQRRLSS